MNKWFNKYALTAFLALLTASALAKDDNLKKEIVVDKDYVPVEQKVSKINETPKTLKIRPENKDLEYSSWTSPVPTGNTISLLSPYGYRTSQEYNTWRGYIDFGIGTHLDMTGSAGVKILNSDDTMLRLRIQHNSSWGRKHKSTLSAIDPQKKEDKAPYATKFTDENIALDFTHNFNSVKLYTSAFYHFARHNLFDCTSQIFRNVNEFGINAAIDNNETESQLQYNLAVAFNRFASDDNTRHSISEIIHRPVNENHLKINGGLTSQWGDNSKTGVDLIFDYLGYSDHTGINPGFKSTADSKKFDHNRGILTLTPNYTFQNNNFSMRLGANLHIAFSDGGIKISPDVKIRYSNSRQNFGIFLHTTGQRQIQSYASLFATNRYIDIYSYPISGFTPLNAKLGFNIGPFAGFKITLWGGYSINRDMPLQYYNHDTPGPLSQLVYDFHDIKGFGYGAQVSYTHTKIFSTGISVAATNHKDGKTGYYTSPDRANCTIKAHISINPVRKLNVRINYTSALNRKLYTRVHPSTGETFTQLLSLGDIHNLSASARYDITPQIAIWLLAHNLLNRDNRIAPRIYAHGISVLGGFSLKF